MCGNSRTTLFGRQGGGEPSQRTRSKVRERIRSILRAFGARCKRALFSEGALQLGCVPWLPPRFPPPQWSLQLRSARAPSTSPGPPSPKVGSLHSSRCLVRSRLCVRRAWLSRVSPCATGSPGVLGGGAWQRVLISRGARQRKDAVEAASWATCKVDETQSAAPLCPPRS